MAVENIYGKSILLIGAGGMGRCYAQALYAMGAGNVFIISKSGESAKNLAEKYGFRYSGGGYEKHLKDSRTYDLVIIATPIGLLCDAAKTALEYGQINILVEKPGALSAEQILGLAKMAAGKNLRVAYNRVSYPSFFALKKLTKDQKITSCKYNFTEWIHKMNFADYSKETLAKWGIANSLHVISMAHELIGMPQEISSYQIGYIGWHAKTFVGGGISRNNVAFSYHADWGSPDRWSIEILTPEKAYRLMPLEELYVRDSGAGEWKKIDLKTDFHEVKSGLCEQIEAMFNFPDKLISLERAADYIELAQKIFGYK